MNIKRVGICLFVCCFPLSVQAAENSSNDTKILGGLSTGEVRKEKPASPKVRPNFRVKNTSRQQVKGRNVTIQEVEPPVLREKKEAVEQPSTPEASEPQQIVETRFIGVSATVYGKGKTKRTRLKVFYNGQVAEAWSNIDGNVLGGFSGFRANGREYMIMLSHANARDDQGAIKDLNEATKQGCPSDHWVFQSNRANFAVTKVEDGDQHSQQILGDLHKLYRAEKDRLHEAHKLRKQNKALKGNNPPPPPKDVTIRFWKRDVEQEQKERGAK